MSNACRNAEGDAKQQIISVLLMDEFNSQGQNSPSDETRSQIADAAKLIVDELVKYGQVLQGKPKQVRFSPSILRMALCLYGRSPAAYAEFKDASFMILPSESTLNKMKYEMSVNEGICSIMYSWFYDESTVQSSDMAGHIMADEMKLKHGLVWNCLSTKIIGFTSDSERGLDLKDELRSLL